MKKKIRIISLLILYGQVVFASGGSDTVASVEPFTTFFEVDNATNAIRYLAHMHNGFELENSSTVCECRTLHSIAGSIYNRGTLNLQTDLQLRNDASFEVLGTINCNGRTICLSESIETLSDNPLTLINGTLALSRDVLLQNSIICQGDCIITGSNHTLTLLQGAEIIVDSGATLTIQQVAIDGLSGSNIRCVDDIGQINLVDCRLNLQDDFVFGVGAFVIRQDVMFMGAHTFSYESDKTSLLDKNCKLMLQGNVNFKVGRFDDTTTVEPLEFVDETSRIILNNCTLTSNEHGINLTKGKIVCAGIVTVVIKGENEKGIYLGTGSSVDDDFHIDLEGGAFIQLTEGSLFYNNISPDSVQSLSRGARIFRKAGSAMVMMQNATFPSMILELETDFIPPLQLYPGKRISYKGTEIVLPSSSYLFTGVQDQVNHYLFEGNDIFLMAKGVLPIDMSVQGGNNIINGSGILAGSLTLNDMYAWVVWSLNGAMKNDVALNGGTIILQSDLKFITGGITSGGVIKLGENSFIFASDQELMDQNMVFDGDKGSVRLTSDLKLNSSWTISGEVTIDGGGYELCLDDLGEILVTPSSKVIFKNVTLTNIKDFGIKCLDDTATIEFSNAFVHLSGDYEIDTGAMEIHENVLFAGQHLFVHTSSEPITIKSNAYLKLTDKIKFLTGRVSDNATNEPFVFTDRSSLIELDNCYFIINEHGARFTKGTMICSGVLNVETESSDLQKALIFGDGIDQDNDFVINVRGGAIVSLRKGKLVFDNLSPDRLNAYSTTARVARGLGTTLVFNQDFNLPAMTVELKADNVPPLQIAPGKKITYNETDVVLPIATYQLTAEQNSINEYLFTGNDSIFLTKGVMPLDLMMHGANNVINGNGLISGSISLADLYTWAVWIVNGSMQNDIDLNGGTLILQSNLKFISGNIASGGTIKLGENSLILASDQSVMDQNMVFNGTRGEIRMSSNIRLDANWTISGDVTINGAGYELTFDDLAEIIVAPSGTLRFKNVVLTDVTGNTIRCLDDDGMVEFSQVRMLLSDNYAFDTGKMMISEDVTFAGPHSFTYQSSKPITIKSHAHFTLTDGIALDTGRISETATNEPFIFTDRSSLIELDDCDFIVNEHGARFVKGTMICSGVLNVETKSSDSNKGLIFGDGVTSDNDFMINVRGGAIVNLKNGVLVFDNLSPDMFNAYSTTASVSRGVGTTLVFNQDFNLPSMTIELKADNVPPLQIAPGKKITYNETYVVLPVSTYQLTAEQNSINEYLFSGNDSIFLTKGLMPLDLMMRGANNVINGNGIVSGLISLADLYTWVVWIVNGSMQNDIDLNGGTLILQSDLHFVTGKIASSGSMKLGTHTMSLAPDQTKFDQNIVFEAQKGGILLTTDFTLNGSWTISGDVILDGNGFALDFGAIGQITIAPNSCLHLKNITLNNVIDGSLGCMDDTGIILMDSISYNQSEDVYFEFGKIVTMGTVKFDAIENIFHYNSTQPLQISEKSKFKINNGLIFNYEPSSNADNLFQFVGKKSVLALIDGTLQISNSDLTLSGGQLTIQGSSRILVDNTLTDVTVNFGTGVEKEDCHILVKTGSILRLENGTFDYHNTKKSSLDMINDLSQIVIGNNTTLRLYEDMRAKKGRFVIEDDVIIEFALGADLFGVVVPLGNFTRQSLT